MSAHHRSVRGWLAGVLAALSLLGVSACGGGGGGGGGPTMPPPPQPGIRFTPSGAPAANSVHLAQGAGTTAQLLVLEVRATQVNGFYGIAFDLGYPAAVLNFMDATEGDFLAAAGDTSFQIAESPDGNLVVGLTLLGEVAPAAGSGLVLTLRFAATGGGDGNFSFSDNEVYRATGAPNTAISWLAGSVQVTPGAP